MDSPANYGAIACSSVSGAPRSIWAILLRRAPMMPESATRSNAKTAPARDLALRLLSTSLPVSLDRRVSRRELPCRSIPGS
jgi:hypothetical protein